ncbi:MAG: pyrroloquinoline quinone-dependent dehydrogenase [Proteobacteria bacterium]|nr:pyrroloquinoline quinone-dependent dehydrogenase [Pseudomonadota bacterium]
MNSLHKSCSLSALILLLAFNVSCSQDSDSAMATTSPNDWPMFRGNPAGTGFSALDQITAGNVGSLTQAWSYSLRNDEAENARDPNSQATPIVVDGVMYLPTVDQVVALDSVTGEELWSHSVGVNAPSRRGVSYWPGQGGVSPRIFFTAFDRLVALDAETGTVDREFGESGEVDLGVPYISVPMIYEDVIVVGANTPRGAIGGIGNARAFSAQNGARLWEFSSVPQPGSAGHDTWEGDSWVGRLGANAWPFYFTVDEERDQLYIPLASPIPFGYGGDRAGSNLYSNSLVAVDIHSGEYAWHFQTIHHDLWDHDPPAPPALFDVTRSGRTIPALGVTTKSGYLYVLNRETGEPIYGVEERPMPQSNVPGEETFATQPIPVKPAAMARVSYDPADLVTAADTNAEHAQACAELVESVGEIYNAGAFTPWTYRPDGTGGQTTLLFPGLAGGPNWGGVAHNPNNGYVYVFAADIGTLGWMEDAEPGSDLPYVLSGPRPAGFDVRLDGRSMPCQKPPWGKLTAVDTATGDIVWQIPLGITEGLTADKQRTGRPGRAAALITASNLLFIAATDDNYFRALDASSGEIIWEQRLERRGNANPMTYLGSDGKQYVVITATDNVVSFSLP